MNIIKNQINVKPRMISAKWTLEELEELNIDKEFSKILQELNHINENFLFAFLCYKLDEGFREYF